MSYELGRRVFAQEPLSGDVYVLTFDHVVLRRCEGPVPPHEVRHMLLYLKEWAVKPLGYAVTVDRNQGWIMLPPGRGRAGWSQLAG